MSSLASRIALLAVAVLAVIGISLDIIDGATARRGVRQMTDAQLMESAVTLDQVFSWSATPGEAATIPVIGAQPRSPGEAHKYLEKAGFQYWGSDNRLVAASDNLRGLALDAAPAGYADLVVDRHHWRVLTRLADDGRWIRVAARDDVGLPLVRAIALQALLLAIGVAIVGLAIAGVVQAGLAPVGALAERIAGCSPTRTQPIAPGGLPPEFEPVVAAINALLTRFRTAGPPERRLRIARRNDATR